MKVLDLFCGAGGSAMGLSRAGFDIIIGIDIKNQPHYPFEFVKGDALNPPVSLNDFDLIWASPRCQTYSPGTRKGREIKYPDQVVPTQDLLKASRKPYVIENVIMAPLRRDLILSGRMFGISGLQRKRLFEIEGFRVEQPHYRKCLGEPVTVAGHVRGKRDCISNRKRVMGISWMTGKEIVQAVPPVYAEYIGKAFLRSITRGMNDLENEPCIRPEIVF